MNQIKTKEQIEYEKAKKEYEKQLKTMHELSLKAALSEEGIDTSKISRQKMDEIRRLRDKQGPVRQNYQDIINQAQQKAQEIMTRAQLEYNNADQEGRAAITKAQQDLNAEIAGIQNEIEAVVESIKVEQGVVTEPDNKEAQPEEQTESAQKEAGTEPED